MAKNDNDDANDYNDPNEEPRPPRRKKKDLENWANQDMIPISPNPGQVIGKRKKKEP